MRDYRRPYTSPPTEGDYSVKVTPAKGETSCPPETSRTGFDLWTTRDCPAAKVESGECNIGAFRQCQQFKPPPLI